MVERTYDIIEIRNAVHDAIYEMFSNEKMAKEMYMVLMGDIENLLPEKPNKSKLFMFVSNQPIPGQMCVDDFLEKE